MDEILKKMIHILNMCDFRWQREAEPVDPRFVGENFTITEFRGAHAEKSTKVNMDQMKKKWKI